MGTSTGVLPEKRSPEANQAIDEDAKRSRITESPEDSQSIDCFAPGKVAGEVLDSDDDMYFDSPGSFTISSWDRVNGVAISWDLVNGWQPMKDPIPAWSKNKSAWNGDLEFCFLCMADTGHLGYECPYRCEEIFKNARCWKKFHHEDKHDYGYPSEPCVDCENTEFGCDEHYF